MAVGTGFRSYVAIGDSFTEGVGDELDDGLVVIQDDVNDIGTQNFKYVDWRDIRRALGL